MLFRRTPSVTEELLSAIEIAAGELERDVTQHGAPVNSVAFSADGLWVLSGSEDGDFRVIFGDLRVETVSAERLSELESVD